MCWLREEADRAEAGQMKGNAIKILLQWAKWNWCTRAYITVMPKRGKKGAVVEDAEEPKTEPEAKKSKAGAKKNEKEAVGEGAVLYEDPSDQKTSPSGKSATLKICSWNVDGLRAWIKKKGLDVSGIKGVQRLILGFNHLFPS